MEQFYSPFQDQVCLKGPYRGQTISSSQLNLFPKNCIGLVKVCHSQGITGNATGFLLTSCTVITTAHDLIVNYQGRIYEMKPHQFCLGVNGHSDRSNKINVIDFRIPVEYRQILKDMADIPDPRSEEYYKLLQKSFKYDYALLKLEKNVQRQELPILCPDFDSFGQKVTVCGYSNEKKHKQQIRDNFKMLLHSNPLQQSPYQPADISAMYDIDTKSGQSGSPVYYVEMINGVEKCCVVGIHKGADKKLNKNLCLLFSSDIVNNLRIWMDQMILTFRTKEEKIPAHRDSFPLVPPIAPKYNVQSILIDSEVLRMKGTLTEDIKYISESLCTPKEVRLIFRASENQFRASAFHHYCDGIKDTLTILRTQGGRTIAGYSHYSWGVNEEKQLKDWRGWVVDGSRKAFILLLDYKQKMVPQLDWAVVDSHDSSGPVFGFDSLHIGDKCNTEACSTTLGIGGRYNGLGTDKYRWKSMDSIFATSGSREGHKFRITEYEVFSVSWEPRNKEKFQEMLRMTKARVDREFEDRRTKKQLTQFDQFCIKNNLR